MKQSHTDKMISNIKSFAFTRTELENRLRWYEKKYGRVVQKRGLHNWKNLFRRPNIYEATIFFMLILALFMGWAYTRDFAVYEQNIQQQCCEICYWQTNPPQQQGQYLDLNIPFKEANSIEEEVT